MKCAISLITITVLTVGCVTARSEFLGKRYSPKPSYSPIEVYDSLSDVERPYTKVARISGSGAPLASWGRVLRAMKEEARRVGADALVLREEYTEVNAVDNYGNVYRGKRKRALAIRYNEEEIVEPITINTSSEIEKAQHEMRAGTATIQNVSSNVNLDAKIECDQGHLLAVKIQAVGWVATANSELLYSTPSKEEKRGYLLCKTCSDTVPLPDDWTEQ